MEGDGAKIGGMPKLCHQKLQSGGERHKKAKMDVEVETVTSDGEELGRKEGAPTSGALMEPCMEVKDRAKRPQSVSNDKSLEGGKADNRNRKKDPPAHCITPEKKRKALETSTVWCDECKKEWGLENVVRYYRCADKNCNAEMVDYFRDDLSPRVKEAKIEGIDSKKKICFNNTGKRFEFTMKEIRKRNRIDPSIVEQLLHMKTKAIEGGLLLPETYKLKVDGHAGIQDSLHNCEVALALEDKRMFRSSFYSLMYFVHVGYSHVKSLR